MPRRVQVHQRSLRQADERAARREHQHKREQQRQETLPQRNQQQAERKRDAASGNQYLALPGIAENANGRLNRTADQVRQAEQHADLFVTQFQVAADGRQRGALCAVHQLVQQFDQQQRQRKDERGAHDSSTK